MIDTELWGEIWQVLKSNRTRTLLTASGIFWGIFILIVMLGFGNGLQSGVNKTMTGYAVNSMYLWTRRTSMPWQGLPPGRYIGLTNRDTEALIAQVPGIEVLAPRINNGFSDVLNGNKVTDAEIIGDVAEFRSGFPMTLPYGRFINQLDVAEKRKVVVLGERIHRDLFGEGINPVGRQVQIKKINFTVIGVYKPERYGGNQEEFAGLVLTPITTMQQVFNYGDHVGYYMMMPKPGFLNTDVAEAMKRVIKKRHRVAPTDGRAIGDYDTNSDVQRIENLFTGIRAFIWTVGIATLLSGVLGVSNIMLIAIRERRREFGIRKSIGATPRSVLTMVLAETATLVTVSGVLGLFAGLLALFIVDLITRPLTQNPNSDVLFDTPTIDLKIALAAIIALAVASLLATLIPARHAMKINPVEALRTE